MSVDRLRRSLMLCDEHTRASIRYELRTGIGHAILAGNVRGAWVLGELLRLVCAFENDLALEFVELGADR